MRLFSSLFGIGVALCMTGCVTYVVQPEAQPVQPVQQQDETPVTPSRGSEVKRTTTELPSTETKILGTAQDKPRVAFRSLTSDGSEATFCKKVASECVQRLLPRQARVVTAPKADMTVVFDAEFKEVSSFGEYVLMECKEFRVRIIDVNEEELSSMIVIHPQKMPRKLGRDEAINQYVAPVCTELFPKLSDEIARLAGENINVEEVTFLVKCAPSSNQTDEFRREMQRIKGILDGESGILSWELSSQDAENQRCTFRVVYKKGSFREGLGNKLGLK